MTEIISDVLPTSVLAVLNLRDEATAWVGLACTLAVTICSCVVNLYRMWRDRDTDIKKKEKEEQENNDK